MVLLSAVVCLYAVYAIGGWGDERTRFWLSYAAALPVGLAAVVLLWWAARHSGLEPAARRGWALIALAVLCYWVGDATWFLIELTTGQAPFPSWGDAFYLLFYPLTFIGLLAFPAIHPKGSDRTRAVLDAATAALAGGMIIWFLVLSPRLGIGGAGTLEVVVSVAYPVLDLVLLFTASFVWTHHTRPRLEGALRWLFAGLFATLVADLLFAVQSLDNTYVDGGLVDVVFLCSSLFFGLAAYTLHRDAAEEHVERRRLDPIDLGFVPYAAVASGFGLLLYAVRDQLGTELGSMLLGAFVLTAAVIVRQIMSLRARKRAEMALRSSQELLQGVISASPVAVAATDEDENITLWSPAAERIFGWTTDEVVGRPWPAVPPEKRMESDQIRDGWLRGEDLGTVEMVRLRKDGALIEIESRFARLLNAGGEVIGSVSVMQDVTAERQARKHLHTLIQAAPMAVIVTDVDEKVQLWNPAAERIFGWTEQEVLGTPLPYVSLEMREESERHRRRSVAGETIEGLDLVRRRKDGRLINLQLWSAPLRDLKGQVVGLIGLLRDVTEEKLVQEQLRQSQKMEAVGQLAGGIAHDFNNLLTAIIGNAELVLSGDCSPESVAAEVREIKSAAERAGSLTHQILAFSRRQTLQPRVVPIADVVRHAAPLLERTLGEMVDLRFHLDPDTGLTEVDPHQLEQVLLNLSVNSRDAMVPGGRLTIETSNTTLDEAYCATHPGSRPGDYVLLSVSDDGCGMDAATLEHIFEPFFTTKPLGQGTGLGLATVHGIVLQSGGSIAVDSEPNVGTTFKVYLPRRGPEEAPSEPTPLDATERGDGAGTILVVEDEPAVLALVYRVLARHGYRVLKAAHGADVEFLLDQNPERIDLLLTDVLLPGSMQGTAVADYVKARRGPVPVLFMSGYPRDSIVREGRLAEGINLIEKPFSPDKLVERVQEMMDSR